ncbi:MAG TPA: hypothetical protein PLE74_03970 [Candidatus Cloacimonadota bacterium]|nr:hypothetical protein [Candidatus Cloacimonadota bacterium]HPT71417.1 hypothetical protein [Candidatus Cloacimonadota bacterium]
MKKIILSCLLFTFTLILLAETPQAEAIQSLDNAKGFIQQNNMQKAQDEINFALSKISEIQSEELVNYLPDTIPGFKLNEKNAEGLGQAAGIFGGGNGIMAKGNYYNDNEGSIDITINVGGIMSKTSALAQMFGAGAGAGVGTGTKSVRVNGYSGTIEFDSSSKDGKLTVQVGEKINIIVEGSNIDSAETLKTIAGKIDMAKLEKAF